MPDTQDIAPSLETLDALTQGAFSAETSSECAERVRAWLDTAPDVARMQQVFHALENHKGGDKAAARAVRERLDEIRRHEQQEAITAHWVAQAQALLEATPLDVARAAAWQRDAARAGAALSREPLAQWRARIAEQVRAIKGVQHQTQVQHEAALLLAQRIEVLSTKPWREALAALDGVRADVGRWQEQCAALQASPQWGSLPERLAQQTGTIRAHLVLVWEAFDAALGQTRAAAQDNTAPLPSVPVWAEELRAARGLPPQNILHSAAAPPAQAAPGAAAHAAASPPAAEGRELQELQEQRAARAAAASAAITRALEQFEAAMAALAQAPIGAQNGPQAGAPAEAPETAPAAEGDAARQQALHALHAAIRTHGRMVDDALAARVHAAMQAAGDAQGWPRHEANERRQELLARARELIAPPEGQPPVGGRKLHEALRQLREQWQHINTGNPCSTSLRKKFDQACHAIHQQAQAWYEQQRSQSGQAKAARLALIEEIDAWGQAQADNRDWKFIARNLRQFAERWRSSGHVGEKLYAELHPQFRQAMGRAGEHLQAAQQATTARRQALIEEATTLAAGPTLPMDAVRSLQQRWQQEAQSVPLPRVQEQKLWEAFRQPLDAAFQQRKNQPQRPFGPGRGAAAAAPEALSAHEQRVLAASQALQQASAAGEAQAIHHAMAALQEALQGDLRDGGANAPASTTPPPADTADAPAAPVPEVPAPQTPPPDAASAPRPAVRAVRGDDRPGAARGATTARNDGPAWARRGERGDSRQRPGMEQRERRPHLSTPVFRAQREALEQAQQALRRMAVQTHGEVLTQLLAAWQARDAAQLPPLAQLGRRVDAATRGHWVQALTPAAQQDASDAHQALLRLEMAAELPTAAEHLDARRALQLQLLTRRDDPPPARTWGRDAARVLACAWSEALAQRLRATLRVLLRPA